MQRPTLFDSASAGAAARVDFGQAPVAVSATAQAALSAMPAAGSGETLDRLVVSSWERLVSHAAAPCLLCGGTMEPAYAAHAAPIGGRCRDCGTTLG